MPKEGLETEAELAEQGARVEQKTTTEQTGLKIPMEEWMTRA